MCMQNWNLIIMKEYWGLFISMDLFLKSFVPIKPFK